MKNNLKDYIVKQSSFLENDFCDETIIKLNELEKLRWGKHHYHQKDTGKLVSNGEQELDILYAIELDNTQIIMDKLWQGIANYVDSFEFHWFQYWSGYSLIRYNRYSENQKMEMHCDHIQTLFDGEYSSPTCLPPKIITLSLSIINAELVEPTGLPIVNNFNFCIFS